MRIHFNKILKDKTSYFNDALKHLTMRQKVNLFIICLTIISASFLVYKLRVSADISSQDITNQATIKYCTEGDAIDICNPASNLYSGSAVSNILTIQKITANIKLVLLIRSGSNQTSTDTTIQILNSTTNAVIATLNSQTISTSGDLTITDSAITNALNDNTTYKIRIKVPGFLGKTKSANNILSQQVVWVTADMPIWGDIDNNNTLGITDLISIIRAKNGGTDTAAKLAISSLGHSPSLADIVTWIRNYNTNPNGE